MFFRIIEINMINEKRQELFSTKKIGISCVVPIYNEQNVISEFLCELNKTLEKLSDNFEIIVVDDGSKDQSLKRVAELSLSNLKVLSFSRNFGKEIALTAGIEHASKDVTILIDCDFQHPLEVIPTFLTKWVEGYDMVYAVRENRQNESLTKRFAAKLFYRLLGVMNEIDIPPHAGDFRLMDHKIIKTICRFEERNRFMKGVYAWVGYRTATVTYTVQERKNGQSNYSFWKLFRLALNGIFSFSDLPLRIWSLIGLIISTISFIYGLSIILDTLLFGADVPGYATIIVAIMFFGGIQLLSIGILGEYIARIFTEVKKRPKYILKYQQGFDAK